MDNNRKQQCTTVARPTDGSSCMRRWCCCSLRPAPASADGDPEAGRVNEFAGTHGAPDAVPSGGQPMVVSIQIAQAEVAPPS